MIKYPRKPEDLTKEQLVEIVTEIRDVLWNPENIEEEWEVDTIEWVAGEITRWRLAPEDSDNDYQYQSPDPASVTGDSSRKTGSPAMDDLPEVEVLKKHGKHMSCHGWPDLVTLAEECKRLRAAE